MRPCAYELIKGLLHTWENEALPIVADAGQGEILRRMRGGSVVLRLLAATWGAEGEAAHRGNNELRRALGASIPALHEAGLGDVALKVETRLVTEYVPPGAYPALRLLLQEADDLRLVLTEVLTAVAAVENPPATLEQAHDALRGLLRLQVERDLHLDKIIRGDFSQVEEEMDEYIATLDAPGAFA
jgi:hypothetical protein